MTSLMSSDLLSKFSELFLLAIEMDKCLSNYFKHGEGDIQGMATKYAQQYAECLIDVIAVVPLSWC